MVVKTFVVVGANVAAGKVLFNPAQEIRVHSHHVFKVAVNGAILDHPNLAIPFKNRGLDFSHFLS